MQCGRGQQHFSTLMTMARTNATQRMGRKGWRVDYSAVNDKPVYNLTALHYHVNNNIKSEMKQIESEARTCIRTVLGSGYHADGVGVISIGVNPTTRPQSSTNNFEGGKWIKIKRAIAVIEHVEEMLPSE